jgi:hypothetical protein
LMAIIANDRDVFTALSQQGCHAQARNAAA